MVLIVKFEGLRFVLQISASYVGVLPESFGMFVVFHEPARRLRTEPYAAHENERRNERRAKLQSPGDPSNVLDNNVGCESQEDAHDDPELPKHDLQRDGQHLSQPS